MRYGSAGGLGERRSGAGAAQRSSAPSGMLFFSFDYPPNDGGIARLCAELVCGLQRQGAAIRVLSQQHTTAGSLIPPAPEKRVTQRRPWRELAALRELRRTAGKFTSVICAVWYPEGLLATLAGVRSRVILAHGLELRPRRERWRRRLWRALMGMVLGRATLVIANSNYTAELVRTSGGGARVTALPLGVDHRRFRPGDRQTARHRLRVPEDKLVLVTVARLVRYKGHSLVFKALAALPDAIRADLIYLIAGQGRDMLALQDEAAALGVDKVVRWLGYVAEADLLNLYQSADLFLLCTREDRGEPDVEGFGLAFLEAQACGIPVVGTRTGGIPDAIQESRGGWLIDQDDVAALVAIILRLAQDPGEFQRMGRLARDRIESECTADLYVSRFLENLKRHGIPVC
jgi:phosphatidyl-myo-inositol dimannoside synthase